jgi:hypothetical protein
MDKGEMRAGKESQVSRHDHGRVSSLLDATKPPRAVLDQSRPESCPSLYFPLVVTQLITSLSTKTTFPVNDRFCLLQTDDQMYTVRTTQMPRARADADDTLPYRYKFIYIYSIVDCTTAPRTPTNTLP